MKKLFGFGLVIFTLAGVVFFLAQTGALPDLTGDVNIESVKALVSGKTAKKEIIPVANAAGTPEIPRAFVSLDGLTQVMLPAEATATAQFIAAIPTAPQTAGSEQAKPAATASNNALVEVIVEALNVRAGPGVDYDKVGRTLLNDRLSVIESKGDWLHISKGTEIDGWVAARFVKPLSGSQTLARAAASPPTATPSPAAPPTATATFAVVNPPSAQKDKPTPAAAPASEESEAAPAPAPSKAAASAPSGIRVPSPSYGLAVHLLGGDGPRGDALNRVQELGFEWVKIQIRWLDYEGSAKGAYKWDWLDPVAADVNGRGLKLLVSVVAAPEWARPQGDDYSMNGVPQNPQDLGDFLAAMAQHYPGQIAAIEVWNEQNLAREVGGLLSVDHYTAMLQSAYASVKAVDPNIIIVSGGLTPTGTNDGYTAIDDRTYLQKMVAAGAFNYADAVGAHPSGFNLPPDADWRNPPQDQCGVFEFSCSNPHPSWSFKATLEDYHNILAAAGINKQVWATEFGWAVCGVPQAGYEYCQDNTGWEQREWLRRAYQLIDEWGWDWVGAMFVWNLNYAEFAPGSEMAAFSILDQNGNPTDAFEGLKGLAK